MRLEDTRSNGGSKEFHFQAWDGLTFVTMGMPFGTITDAEQRLVRHMAQMPNCPARIEERWVCNVFEPKGGD